MKKNAKKVFPHSHSLPGVSGAYEARRINTVLKETKRERERKEIQSPPTRNKIIFLSFFRHNRGYTSSRKLCGKHRESCFLCTPVSSSDGFIRQPADAIILSHPFFLPQYRAPRVRNISPRARERPRLACVETHTHTPTASQQRTNLRTVLLVADSVSVSAAQMTGDYSASYRNVLAFLFPRTSPA